MHSDLISPKILTLIICYSVAFFGFFAFLHFSDVKTKVVFCDVGAGDATYIRLHNRIDILVDAGPGGRVASCLGQHMPFYDKTIEYVFLTHVKKSQYEGFHHLLKRYSISNFIVSSKKASTGSYQDLIDVLATHHTKITSPIEGDGIKIADGEFRVILPQSLPNAENRPSKKYAYTLEFVWRNVGILFVGFAPDTTPLKQAKTFSQKTRLIKISEYGFELGLLSDLSGLAEDAHILINQGESVSENSRTRKISEDLVYIL